MGLFDFLKRKKKDTEVEKVYEEILSDLNRKEKECEKVNEMPDLTPESISGNSRQYHYKDINIWVKWQYGGHYGKSCKSIGIKRGDTLDLMPPQEKDDDPETIAVCWRGIEIGFMKSNRLRSMVHQWKADGLPVLAVASQVGGEEAVYIEFAFYGRPNASRRDSYRDIDIHAITPTDLNADPHTPLTHKKVVFCGYFTLSLLEMMQKAVNAGSVLRQVVTKTVDYLVLGNNDGEFLEENGMTSKERTARKLIAEGYNIQIIDEAEFLKLVNTDTWTSVDSTIHDATKRASVKKADFPGPKQIPNLEK